MTGKWVFVATLALVWVLSGCGAGLQTGGSEAPANPWGLVQVTIGFVPREDAAGVSASDRLRPMNEFLARELGVKVESYVGTSYGDLVAAMGSGQVDVGFLTPGGFALASTEHGAAAILKAVRLGGARYRGQLLVRKEDKIPTCDAAKDPTCKATFGALKGRRLAFVDQASASGYLFPAAFMKTAGIDLERGKFFSQVTFAGGHDIAARSVYTKTVDAAWTFEDVRAELALELAGVRERLEAVAYTGWIPNDAVAVRAGLPQGFVAKLQTALLLFGSTDGGKQFLREFYGIDNLVQARDRDYEIVKEMVRVMGADLRTELAGKP